MASRLFGLTAIMFISLANSADALKCYECSNDPLALYYNKDCASGDTTLLAKSKGDCGAPLFNRCAKGIKANGVTIRACSIGAPNVADTCLEKNGEIGCQCSGDSCNSANGRRSAGSVSALMGLLAVLPAAGRLFLLNNW